MAVTPPYEDESLPPGRTHERASHTVEAILRRDSAVKDAYSDLTLLKNHPEYIFARMPFVSVAVMYKLYVASTETFIRHDSINEEGSARKMIVLRSSWMPSKHTPELMRDIYDEDGIEWTAASVEAFRVDGVTRLHKAHPDSLGLRLLAMHGPIRKLCQARDYMSDPPFPLKKVLELSNAKIEYAADLMKTEPFRLYFRSAHGLELPDMRPDVTPLEYWQDRALRFYLRVKKETYEGCHSLVDSKGSIEEVGLSWLIDNGVLVRSDSEPNLVSLIEVAMQENAVLEAITRIEESAPTIASSDVIEPQLGSGRKLCDEQQVALAILLRKPILAIDGCAGSGKTDFLHVLREYYEDRIFCTAFQGVNVGQLRRVSSRVMTTHRLLFEHSINHSPFRCLLKGVEVLVIDEVGTQSLALFAGILSAFAVCGAPNKKLVLVGDLGQLPPIGGPAPFRHLVDYFAKRDYLARFVHNHRAMNDEDGNAGIIATNASAIRRGVADGVQWDCERFVRSPAFAGEKPEDALMRVIDRFDLSEREFIVVTHRREHVEILCKAIERKFGGTGGPGVQVGHKFAFTKNDYALGTINNEILTLVGIEDRAVKEPRGGGNVVFKRARPIKVGSTTDRRMPKTQRYLIVCRSDGGVHEVLFEGAIVSRIKKASAVTSNAMQGSSCSTVIRVDYSPSVHSTRQRLYTDVTRAEDRFAYVGEEEWFNAAVGRSEPIPRSQLAERATKLRT